MKTRTKREKAAADEIRAALEEFLRAYAPEQVGHSLAAGALAALDVLTAKKR